VNIYSSWLNVLSVELISWVLTEVRIGSSVGSWYREKIELVVHRSSGRNATLPGPEISACCEAIIAYQISSAVSFPIQLSCPLIENKISGELRGIDISGSIAKSALAYAVHIGYSCRYISTGTTP
jgi:hypothetical protein